MLAPIFIKTLELTVFLLYNGLWLSGFLFYPPFYLTIIDHKSMMESTAKHRAESMK
ncbi:hypothetical protein J2S78_000716 [Salibacterium salarium]|nr:hypothetical protein [Salibacterium salarium]